MKFKKINKNTSVLFIVMVLFISLSTNVYTSIMNSRYKMLAGKEAYGNVEDIRNRNLGNLTILNQCIEAKNISNEELLTLYKNYNSISGSFVGLWSRYKTYGDDSIISFKKENDITKLQVQVPQNVYSRIESLIYEYINLEMKSNSEKLIMDKDILDNFLEMREMAMDVEDFYNDFYQNNIKAQESEKRRKEVIKKDYWIDILEGINNTIEPYTNYEFSIKVK